MNSGYVLTTDEFLALAEYENIHNYIFLGRKKTGEAPDQKERIRIAFSLARKEFVRTDGDHYLVDSGLQDILQIIGKAEYACLIRYQKGRAPHYCICRDGERYVVMESMAVQAESMRLTLYDQEAMREDILWEQELPSEIFEDLPEMQEMIRSSKEYSLFELSGTEDEGDILFLAEYMDMETGNRRTRIMIRRDKRENLLIMDRRSSQWDTAVIRKEWLFTRKKFDQCLGSMLEELK